MYMSCCCFFASHITIILFLYLYIYFYRLAVNKSCSKVRTIKFDVIHIGLQRSRCLTFVRLFADKRTPGIEFGAF